MPCQRKGRRSRHCQFLCCRSFGNYRFCRREQRIRYQSISLSSLPQMNLLATRRIAVTGLSTNVSDSHFFRVTIKPLIEEPFEKNSAVLRTLLLAASSKIREITLLGHPLFTDYVSLINFKISEQNPSELADLCVNISTAPSSLLQHFLEELDVISRLKKAIVLLNSEIEICRIMLGKR